MLHPLELPLLSSWHTLLAAAPALAVAAASATATLGSQPAMAWRAARWGTASALCVALVALAMLALAGPGQAIGLRSDFVGAVVGLLVAFIGWIIVRYSQPYLAGEAGEAGYVRWLMATLAAVMVVVASNNLLLLALAWMASSLALHRLLLFFGARPAARIAAHKKFIAARAADLCMAGAVLLLYLAFGTLQIDTLLALAMAETALPIGAQLAVGLIAVAALLKCAQLPLHGWLIQVMEAPTPVSALLHAGIVNLGGFVLIRLAPLVAEVPAAMLLLVAVGGFTAVVAALVMSTRISIKVALAWSTAAQMGFMLMQCGLGLWEMALLHLVAHSLYKAHAFLGAGGTVRQTLLRQMAPAAAPARLGPLAGAALAGVVMVALAGWVWGIGPDSPAALWVMGGIVALALTPLLHAAGGGASLALRGAASAFALALLYFGLHEALHQWVAPQAAVPTGAMASTLAAAVALCFAGLFALQSLIAARPGGALARSLYPWFYGGLFLDEAASRRLFRLWPVPHPPATDAAQPAALAEAEPRPAVL